MDPFVLREIQFESGLEAAWLMVLIADPNVHEVREQQKLDVPGLLGSTTHYFDFVVTWKCGWRTAGAVKYAEDVDDELLDLLERAGDSVGDRFANDYRLFQEDGINRTMLWNARQIISCAKDFDFEAQAAMSRALAEAGEFVRLRDCDALLGDGQRGSRAATALIKSGRLVIEDDQRLGADTVLRNLFTN